MKPRWAIYARFIRPAELNTNEWVDSGQRCWTLRGAKKYANEFNDFAYKTWGTMYAFDYRKDSK